MDSLELRARELVGAGLSAEDLAHGVVDGMLACEALPDGERLAVAYVAWDEYPPPALHDGSDGRGRVMRVDGSERGDLLAREFIDAAASEGLWLHEAPAAAPDQARPAIPGATGARWIHAGRPGMDAADAARELRAHAAWRSGELCGVVVEVFAPDGQGGMVSVDQVADWPRVGRQDALGLLPDALAPRLAPPCPGLG